MNAPVTRQRRDKRAIARWILLAAVVAYLVTFVLSNRDDVQVSFLFFDADTSLVFALALAGVLGFVLGWATSFRRRRSD